MLVNFREVKLNNDFVVQFKFNNTNDTNLVFYNKGQEGESFTKTHVIRQNSTRRALRFSPQHPEKQLDLNNGHLLGDQHS